MALTPDGDKLKNDSLDHMKTLYNWANASACPGVAALLKTGNVKVGDITRGDVFKVAYGNTVSQSIGVTVSQSIGYKCDTALAASQELKVGISQSIGFAFGHAINFSAKSEWCPIKKDLSESSEATTGRRALNFLTLGISGLVTKHKYGDEEKKVAMLKEDAANVKKAVALEELKIAKRSEEVANLDQKIVKYLASFATVEEAVVAWRTNAEVKNDTTKIQNLQTEIQKSEAKLVKLNSQLISANALTLLPG